MRLLTSLFLAGTLSIQLLILGPAFLIPANADELSARLSDLLGLPLVAALLMTVLLGAIAYFGMRTGRYWIASVLAAFGLYVCLQFYFLVPDLGTFDGRASNFEGHTVFKIIEVFIFVGLLAIALKAPRKMVRIATPILGIFVLGQVILIGFQTSGVAAPPQAEASDSDLISPNFTRTSPGRTRGITELSPENIIVILIDTLQGDMFAKMLRDDPVLADAFGGFTLYANTAGLFPFTGLSVAAILTGDSYDGTETIPDYHQRITASRLEARLHEVGYQIDLLPLGARQAFNSTSNERCLSLVKLYDLALLRQVPTLLKEWHYNHAISRFAWLCEDKSYGKQELDPVILDKITAHSKVSRKGKTFKYMHFYGMHPPGLLRKDCTARDKAVRKGTAATYEQGSCVVGKVANYLRKLRSLGIYDKSMIVVLADHGTLYGPDFLNNKDAQTQNVMQRYDLVGDEIPPVLISSANPTLAVKKPGASGGLQISNAPASLLDVYPTILDQAGLRALRGSGVTLSSLREGQQRQREFLYFRNAKEISNSDYLLKEHWFSIDGPVLDPESWTAIRTVVPSSP